MFISVYSEYNTQARLYNAAISSSQQALEGIRTAANVQPAGFPANSSQISSLTSTKVFVELNRLIMLTIF